MANDNKKINELVSDLDDDPTAELEFLRGADDAEILAESEANTFDLERTESQLGSGDETIASLESDLRQRAETITKLQFDIEQLRSRWAGLEREIEVREEVTKNLTEQLTAANDKQASTVRLLKKHEEDIAGLKAELSGKGLSLQESAREIEQGKNKQRELEARLDDSQKQLQLARDELASLTKQAEAERFELTTAKEQARSLSSEVDNLDREIIAARASEAELRQYIDGRKSDWNKQQSRLAQDHRRIDQLSSALERAKTELQDRRSAQNDLEVRLESLQSERDALITEINKLRNDGSGQASADKELLSKQAGLLASQEFEIGKLTSRISDKEAYADELRRQLQDQLSLTDELQTRLKHLEISLTGTRSEARELSAQVEQLRATNATLVEEKSRVQKEFEKEIRQVRFELGEAQQTIADHASLNEQLTSDLVNTRELSIDLETRLNASEEENRKTISRFKKNLNKIEKLNEELQYKLCNKDKAINALLNELTKRSEAIESIDEIENAIHELDNKMSERIDEGSGADRERVTRLLIGEIEGQELRFPLFKDRLTIGRTVHNDIQLKAAYISRRHAVIVTDDEHTRIVDWGSKNGVFVNSSRVTDQILGNGDIITIGTADFRFEERPKR